MKILSYFILVFLLTLTCLQAQAQRQQLYHFPGECFIMTIVQEIAYDADGEPTEVCLQISIELTSNMDGQTVRISDGIQNTETCDDDCTFTWCYAPGEIDKETITCVTEWDVSSNTQCKQADGCIVIVGYN